MAEALDQTKQIISDSRSWIEGLISGANEAIISLAEWDPEYTWIGAITPPTIDIRPVHAGPPPAGPKIGSEPDYLDIQDVERATKDIGQMPAAPALVSPKTPSPPSLNVIDFSMPNDPIIHEVSIPDRPVVSVPTMDGVEKPSMTSIVVPDAPTVTTPSLRTAVRPKMISVSLPEAPSISFGDFSLQAPAALSVNPTIFSFEIQNIDIEGDSLYIAARDRILNNIRHGGTGLTEAIENAIWNRDLERSEQALADATDKATTFWAKKGFQLPDGLLAHSISELQKEYENRRIDRSREIAIKQADLEQTNIFKSMELGNGLFVSVKDLLIKVQELGLRCLEDTAKYYNEYIDLMIRVHNNSIEIYKAVASVYEAEIRAKASQVEIYRAELEAELTKIKTNELNTNVFAVETQAYLGEFNGLLEANKTIIDTYLARLNAEVSKSRVNESIANVYSSEVSAAVAKYSGEVSASKMLIDIFTAQISAEDIRARVNDSLTRLFASRIEGETARINAIAMTNKAEADSYAAQIQGALVASNIEEAKIRQYAEQVKGFIATVEAYTAECNSMRAEAEIQQARAVTNQAKATAWAQVQAAKNASYMGSLEAYKAASEVNISQSNLAASVAKINSDVLVAMANINQANLQLGMMSAQNRENTRLEALKSVAEISAHLAAGAMSTLNAGASIGYSESRALLPT